MSGKGRGRGRGIPLSYPDGLTCKPAPPGTSSPSWVPPPPPARLSAHDREVLYLKRRLLNMKAAREFRVSGTAEDRDFARYSDRYLDAPVEPFHKSSARSIHEGIHFTSELMPPKKGDAAKRAAAAANGGTAVGGSSRSNGSSSAKGKAKKGAVTGELAKRLRTLEDDDEEDNAEGAASSPRKPKKSRRVIMESDEEGDDDEEQGDDEKKREREGEDGDELEEVEDEEEEDILHDEDQYDFGDGFVSACPPREQARAPSEPPCLSRLRALMLPYARTLVRTFAGGRDGRRRQRRRR